MICVNKERHPVFGNWRGQIIYSFYIKVKILGIVSHFKGVKVISARLIYKRCIASIGKLIAVCDIAYTVIKSRFNRIPLCKTFVYADRMTSIGSTNCPRTLEQADVVRQLHICLITKKAIRRFNITAEFRIVFINEIIVIGREFSSQKILPLSCVIVGSNPFVPCRYKDKFWIK